MGWTLRQHSTLLRRAKADSVCFATQGRIGPASLQRLRASGWTQVAEVPGLAKRVPRAYWKDTFDKLYVFNMTAYSRVAFWDADMMVAAPPDSIFDVVLPGASWVGAVGSKPVGNYAYFQTGMMLIQPDSEVFGRLWAAFSEESAPHNASGQYNRWQARDGTLLRKFFGTNYVVIPDRFSDHRGPQQRLGSTVGVHFRGAFKPWMDRTKPVQTPRGTASKELGYSYLAWWAAYEDLHQRVFLHDEWVGAPPGVSPATHVWLMRGVKGGYFQLLSSEERKRRVPFRPHSILLSLPGESCDAACGAAACDERGLTWAGFDDCSGPFDAAAGGCAGCDIGVFSKQSSGAIHPARSPGGACVRNLLLDPRAAPLCGAAEPGWRRVCACFGSGGGIPPLSWEEWFLSDSA